MSNHAKERGCAHTSFSSQRISAAQNIYQKAVLSAIKYLKKLFRNDLVSFPSFPFLFCELKTHKIAFCTRVSPIFYFFHFNVLYNPRRKIMLILC